MDLQVFLSTLPYLYPIDQRSIFNGNGSNYSYCAKLFQHHERILRSITAPSDNESPAISYESNIFGAHCRYLFTHHLASIEPVNSFTGQLVGPAFFKSPSIGTSSEPSFDPALFRFYAVALSSTSEHCPISPMGKAEPTCSSPAASSASTAMTLSPLPKTPKRTCNSSSQKSQRFTVVKDSNGNLDKPLLYFGFQRVPLDRSRHQGEINLSSALTQKVNPIHFYCVDHFQIASIMMDNPSQTTLELNKVGDCNNTHGTIRPPAVVFSFDSCSFRVFSQDYNIAPPNHTQHLYHVVDWLQSFLSNYSSQHLQNRSMFSAYLNSILAPSSHALAESASPSGPLEVEEEESQRMRVASTTLDIPYRPTLKRKLGEDDSHGNDGIEEKQGATNAIVDSWMMIQNLYSKMKHHHSMSLTSISLPNLPDPFPFELSTQSFFQPHPSRDDPSRGAALLDCEQKIEKVLVHMFPPPRHRILSREYQRPDYSTMKSTIHESRNDMTDICDPTSELEKYLEEYKQLLQERQSQYLLPTRL